MTSKELKANCKYWQTALRLQDWDITIRFARGYDMGDKQGQFCPLLEKKSALIKVLAAQDVSDDWVVPYDPEYVVVHELLHAHFEPFWRDKKSTEQEQAIHAIACGLLAAKHAPVAEASDKALGKGRIS